MSETLSLFAHVKMKRTPMWLLYFRCLNEINLFFRATLPTARCPGALLRGAALGYPSQTAEEGKGDTVSPRFFLTVRGEELLVQF